jgi:hypothetical protein
MASPVATIGSKFPCILCHGSPNGNGTTKLLIPGATIGQTQVLKVPHLRNQYQMTSFNNTPGADTVGGFGFRHDGTFKDLFSFFSQSFFNASIRGDATTKSNLAAFMLCFDTGTAPAVGYSRTLLATNLLDATISNEWSVLEGQVVVTNIDLIAKGTIDGQWHGLFYQASMTNYLPDSTNLPAFSHADLVTKIQNGDTLTIMGVPPGSGRRLGIDRDLDGVLDADVPPPGLQIVPANGGVVLCWPFSAVGFGLEFNDSLLPADWLPDSNAVELIAGQNYVTNLPASDARFYRLKFPAP